MATRNAEHDHVQVKAHTHTHNWNQPTHHPAIRIYVCIHGAPPLIAYFVRLYSVKIKNLYVGRVGAYVNVA